MKKLFNFRLLVLIGVLIMSVPQMWAGKKTIYFDVQNISWWKDDDVVKVHAWGGATTEDVSMTVYSGNMLTCQINDDQTDVCFYRYYNLQWNEQTIDKTDAATKNCWTLWTSTSDSKQEISNGYEYEPTAGLMGGMNSWNAGTLSFDGDGNVSVDLTAGDTHQFKILDGTTWYSYNSYGFSTSATDFTLYTGNSECSITASTTGTYHFHWDRTNHTLCIFFPNDYAKARLTKTKYIYFDARNSDSDHWNQVAFASRFYFKYYDSGQDQSNTKVLASTALETSVYPVTVPDNDYVGRVQINRWSADGTTDWENATSVIHAYTRSSNAENCIVIPEGQASSWTPSVEWTTYCPPKSSSTISDNGTTKYTVDGLEDGSEDHPFLVEVGTAINVSSASTNYITDGNMTTTYRFYDGSTALGTGTQEGTTYSYTASSTANTVHQMKVNALNEYNDATSTDKFSTILYYKAVNCYTVTYYANDATSGSIPEVSGKKYAEGADVTLATNTGTLARSGYSFNGWNTATDGSGTHYAAGGTLDDIAANKKLYAEWSPVALTLSTAGNWNNAANWTETSGGAAGCVPTSGHDVTISKEVTVDINNAVANSITFSSGGKLTIPTIGALEVTGTITNTNPDNIVINTDGSNQGALIFNNSAGTTQATVNMYSKAASGTFQYMAIPLASISVNPTFAGTGTYTYVWHEGTGWERRGYYTDLAAFEPIGLSQTSATTYTMSGTLASTANKTIALASTSESTYQGMNMIGNSWTAPISIAALKTALDNEKVTETVYVYCTGSGNSSGTTETAGQWLAIPIDASGWSGWSGLKVIPAMQAFLIKATAATSVTLNYTNMVRTVESANMNQKLRAPKREAEENITLTTLRVADSRTHTDLHLFEGEKFTNAFDNGWEATFMVGDGSSAQFYAMSEQEKMAVLATPDLEGTVVGFKPGQETEYTISFIGNEAGYYLNDMKTGKSTLIAEGNTYEFTSDESTNATRFVISKIPMQPTGIEDIVEGTNARKQMIDGVLYIIRDGRIYTTAGNVVK